MKLIAKTFLLIGLLIYATPASAQTADMINFQARILDNDGVPLEGTHEFVFAIVDENETILWGPPEVPSVNLTVTEGLYSIKLGDPALGMPPLGMEVFEGQELTYLRVAVDGEQLTEDQQILPVVYAFHAEHAITADEAEHAGQVDYADSSGYADNWDGGTVYGDIHVSSTDHDGQVLIEPNGDPSVIITHYDSDETGRDAIRLWSSDTESGNVFIELVPGVGSGGASLRSIGGCGRLDLHDDEGGFGVELDGCNPSIRLYNSHGELTVEIDGETGNIYVAGQILQRN